MGEICKGKITSISGSTARVTPLEQSEAPTAAKIVVPWHLRDDTGKLKKGTEVVYAVFGDNTRLLLGRADGDWGEWLPKLDVDELTSQGVNLKKHKHGGVDVGSGTTSTPT